MECLNWPSIPLFILYLDPLLQMSWTFCHKEIVSLQDKLSNEATRNIPSSFIFMYHICKIDYVMTYKRESSNCNSFCIQLC